MNPRQFEEHVCEYFKEQSYQTEITPYNNDYGVDIFASKGNEKLAIQAKMYGGTTRKTNRKAIMELHGAKDFFECTGAVIATDGLLLQSAIEVANKLKIKIIYFDSPPINSTALASSKMKTFESIWQEFIIPLQGETLHRKEGKTNKILKVDWSGVERISSEGNIGKIEIEVFKQTINKLLTTNFVSRDEINQNYTKRAASGVILILSKVPFFEVTKKPLGLKML